MLAVMLPRWFLLTWHPPPAPTCCIHSAAALFQASAWLGSSCVALLNAFSALSVSPALIQLYPRLNQLSG